MAPEQIQGKPHPASDQYSLGIVVYEWLSGDRPFHGSFPELCAQHMFASPPPLHEKVPIISPSIEQVVQIALAKNPHQRFAHILDFARAFEQACQFPQPIGLPSMPGSQISSPQHQQYPQCLSQSPHVSSFSSTLSSGAPSHSSQQISAASFSPPPRRQFVSGPPFPTQQFVRPGLFASQPPASFPPFSPQQPVGIASYAPH